VQAQGDGGIAEGQGIKITVVKADTQRPEDQGLLGLLGKKEQDQRKGMTDS